jgi:hypothetical protein
MPTGTSISVKTLIGEILVLVAALLAVLLAASMCLAAVTKRWNAAGVVVCNADYNQQFPRSCSDGLGGSIIVWQDFRSNDHYEIRVQRVDSSGSRRWAGSGDYSGVLVVINVGTEDPRPDIVPDGSNGAIILWTDKSSVPWSIYAHHIKSDGSLDPAWPAWGQHVDDAMNNVQDPVMCADGAGGAIVAWESDTGGGNNLVSIRRVNGADGSLMWGEASRVKTDMGLGEDQADASIVSDGSNGAVVAFRADQDTGDWRAFAQRLLGTDGSRQWGDAAVRVSTQNYDQNSPEITSADSNNYVVVYGDSNGGLACPLFAQKIRRSDGASQWAGSGVVVRVSGTNGNTHLISDDTAAYATWTREGSEVYAQRVNFDGTMSWTAGGVMLSSTANVAMAAPQIASDGMSGVIATWCDTGSGFIIHLQRVSAAGNILWGANGMPVCTVTSGQQAPTMVSDGAMSAIIAWQDDRNPATGIDIYSQKVSNSAPTVTSIDPSSGPNSGTLSGVEVRGTNMLPGATVKLEKSGRSDINATGVTWVSSTEMTCKFNLAGAATGKWDVELTNPDSQCDTLGEAFVVASPCSTWYLAEGTTDWGFSTYVSIVNPNNEAVTAEITYMTTEGVVPGGAVALPPMSQTTVNPGDLLGQKDFSTRVDCMEYKCIAVDRTMTWTGPGAVSCEGHNSIGVNTPAKTWYLAEGSSKWGFETWLLIQNPNDADATCQVTYMIEGESPRQYEKKIPAGSRASYSMFDDVGDKDASIKVESDVPVIPERAMYRNGRREGHDSIGTTTPAKDYYLAEGTTDWGFTTYVLVQNPNAQDNTVTLTCMTPDGPVVQPAVVVPANSRKTIRLNDALPSKDLSTHVEGSLPLIAERAMYWDAGLGEACHDSIGMDSPHTTFYLPDGETRNGYETWTLVQNPNEQDVTVEVRYLTPTGSGNVVFEDTVQALSRKTYDMREKIPEGKASIVVTCKTAGRPIMVERAMYWNGRGAGTDTIGGFSD